MEKVVGCPSCGVLEPFIVYPSIMIPADKKLREQILNENLFLRRCEACGYEVHMVYSCLYQDTIRKFMIYVRPQDEDQTILEQISVEGLEHIRKRIVSTVEELKEKLLIFEAGLNDYAIELVKTALTQVVTSKWGIAPEKSFYCGLNNEKNTMEYVFYLNEEEAPVYQSMKIDVYHASLPIVASIITQEPNMFLCVNSDVANRILKKHQKTQQMQKQEQQSDGNQQENKSKD